MSQKRHTPTTQMDRDRQWADRQNHTKKELLTMLQQAFVKVAKLKRCYGISTFLNSPADALQSNWLSA